MMDDKDHFTLPTEHFTIDGRSRAGHETWFQVRELGLGLDIGRCPDVLVRLPHILITHAHLDHALGIPFYAGQRRLQRLPPGTIFVPSETLGDFQELMRVHEKLEDVEYDTRLVGLGPGNVVRVRRDLEVRTHRATHRVPANAYEMLEIRHKLRREYEGLSGEQLAELRHGGIDPAEEVRHPLLFYTGDTDRGILENNEEIFGADVLMIECSFVADQHHDRAERYRHIHFDDLLDFAGLFRNRIILLTHFSLRYSAAEVQQELRRRCPAVLRERIRLAFPPPWQTL
jgi:ribonuclease Z